MKIYLAHRLTLRTSRCIIDAFCNLDPGRTGLKNEWAHSGLPGYEFVGPKAFQEFVGASKNINMALSCADGVYLHNFHA